MSKKKQDLDQNLAVALTGVAFVALEMVKTVVDATVAGIPSEKALKTFAEKHFPLISAALTSAGIAGGAYLGVKIWVSNLGFWSFIGYSLGFVSVPLWAPVAGALAGIIAVGGGLFGLSKYLQSGRAKKAITAVYGIAKKILSKSRLERTEDEFVKALARQFGLKPEEITKEITEASYFDARNIANEIFKEDEKANLIKGIFPIVYVGDGVFSASERSNMSEVCRDLCLKQGIISEIETSFSESCEKTWDQYESIAKCAKSILSLSSLDQTEFDDSVSMAMENLLSFDPRAEAAEKRGKVLGMVTTAGAIAGVFFAANPFLDATIVGAYALLRGASDSESEERAVEAALLKFLEKNSSTIGSKRKAILEQKDLIDQTLEKTKKGKQK